MLFVAPPLKFHRYAYGDVPPVTVDWKLTDPPCVMVALLAGDVIVADRVSGVELSWTVTVPMCFW